MSARYDRDAVNQNLRRSNISDGYVYTAYSDDVFVYVGKDKSKWHKLDAVLAKEFREQKISYLRDASRLRALRAHPIPTAHIPIPPVETENQREERKRRQEREDKAYNSANDLWLKDQRKIQQDFAIAITIIQKHVSEAINADLQAVIVRAEQEGATEEGKYNAIFNRLTFKYGPFDQKDIEHLRNQIFNLKMDDLGARETMMQFSNLTMSMTLTAKRDGNNNIIRAVVEPALPPALPIHATDPEIINHFQLTENAKAAVAGLEGPALNHRPTDEDLKTYIKRILSETTITHFNNIYVESIKPQNANWTYQDIVDQVERLIDHEAEGIHLYAQRRVFSQMSINETREQQVQALKQLPDRNYYSADTSYIRPYSPGIYSNSSNRDQGRSTSPGRPGGPGGRDDKCANCNHRGHRTFACPSRICGTCKGSFETVEARRDHYRRWHSNAKNNSLIQEPKTERHEVTVAAAAEIEYHTIPVIGAEAEAKVM